MEGAGQGAELSGEPGDEASRKLVSANAPGQREATCYRML